MDRHTGNCQAPQWAAAWQRCSPRGAAPGKVAEVLVREGGDVRLRVHAVVPRHAAPLQDRGVQWRAPAGGLDGAGGKVKVFGDVMAAGGVKPEAGHHRVLARPEGRGHGEECLHLLLSPGRAKQ